MRGIDLVRSGFEFFKDCATAEREAEISHYFLFQQRVLSIFHSYAVNLSVPISYDPALGYNDASRIQQVTFAKFHHYFPLITQCIIFSVSFWEIGEFAKSCKQH